MSPPTLTDALRRTARAVAALPGRGALVACATGHGSFWELSLGAPGEQPAPRAAAEAAAVAWEQALRAEGFTPLVPPRALPGAALAPVAGAEVVALADGAELQARAYRPDFGPQPLEAVRTLETVRTDTEQSVLRLGKVLGELLTTSRTQCEQISRVVSHLDGAGTGEGSGLSAALRALEGEVTSLGAGLQGELGEQRREMEGASAWAADIITLARAVDTIAQSARVLTFNARVESARLGEQGKGFVVIANAIRDLARDVRTTNELVTGLATNLCAQLPVLRTRSEALAKQTETRLGQLQARLGSVREGFEATRGETLDGLLASETAARAIRDQSHLVIQDLQYQDRVSQLLEHATRQVLVLEQALGAEEGGQARPGEHVGELGRALTGEVAQLEAGSVALF